MKDKNEPKYELPEAELVEDLKRALTSDRYELAEYLWKLGYRKGGGFEKGAEG